MYRPPAGSRRLDWHASGVEPPQYRLIEIEPLAVTLGAQIGGVNLSAPISAELFGEIDSALREWKVIVFRDQTLTREQFHAFASRWGTLVEDSLPRQVANGGVILPFENDLDNVIVFSRDEQCEGKENMWHVDGSYRQSPVLGTMLAAVEVPALGGDTMFADMAAAYDNLPQDVRDKIDSLWAKHWWGAGGYAAKYEQTFEEYGRVVPPVLQPVVIDHPRTGRRTLFVNRGFAMEIEGLPPDESDRLLDMLTRQADTPEYQVRVKWEPGMVIFWDNFAVQHYAVNDFWPQKRTMMRATIASEFETGRKTV